MKEKPYRFLKCIYDANSAHLLEEGRIYSTKSGQKNECMIYIIETQCYFGVDRFQEIRKPDITHLEDLLLNLDTTNAELTNY